MIHEHPKLASRSCESCETYEYDERGDLVKTWDPHQRVELPVLRAPGSRPPCWICEKVPEAVREREQIRTNKSHAINLSQRNWMVWRHYRQCKAVGRFPVDPIVERHAGIIAYHWDAWERGEITARLDAIITLVTTMRVRASG